VPRPETLSAEQARRIAIAAQGLAEPRPTGRIDARQLRRVVDRMGLLQIDSVNVLVRSHYLPVFSRLGPYPREVLDTLSWGRKADLFEYWGHAASLIPLRLQPHLRWRMERNRARENGWASRMAARRPGYLDQVRELVRREGPIGAGATGEDRPNVPGSMWNWHDGKIALEYLFVVGEVMTADRPRFERLYDLTERVLPAQLQAVPTPPVEDAQRELVRVSARALGVATLADLYDYFRLRADDTKRRVAELVESGELLPVRVEGWKDPAWLWAEARLPRRVGARALLTPFDPLVWERARTERLFDFRYRIEIYTPAPKRVYGYYVLPFLLGDALAGRVDLKADRASRVLQVRAAWSEHPAPAPEVAEELALELTDMARWLGLDSVAVWPRGDLAPALAAAVGTPAVVPIG
jgi:uncharacterized protein YcaQ